MHVYEKKLLGGINFKNQILSILNGQKPHSWAKKNKINRGIIDRILKNKISETKNLIKLSNALHVSIDQLLTGEESHGCHICMNEEEKDWCKKLIEIFRKKEEHTVNGLKSIINDLLNVPIKKNQAQNFARGKRKKE